MGSGFATHLTEFAGLEILDFPAGPGLPLPAGADRDGPQAWRLDAASGLDADPVLAFGELLDDFLARVDTARVAALVVGRWGFELIDVSDGPVGATLAARADRLPALRALFVAELTSDECDVAYLALEPVTPVLEAFPGLEQLWVRGTAGTGLSGEEQPLLAPIKHETLCTLVFQSGGLDPLTMRAVGACEFPALEHLEFYFGEPRHGGTGTVADVEWLLPGDRLPNLRHLGLRDSMVQDDLAVAVAHAPVVAQLRTLDLSLGALGDGGAAALLAGQPLGHLVKLDLHHHFLSAQMQERLRQAWPGVEIDLSEPQPDGDEWGRYVAVAE
ncbi:STM4015 family protein [Catenulispora yoronensis]|uniref:STM4015 family protein n=1 Tax=Catenulispora yoronensis TaxID=450799 RepID=A0ABN2V8L1_9ACTN